MKFFLVAILAFILGICAVFFWFNSNKKKISASLDVSTATSESCAEIKHFPGLSQKIAELEKGKSRYFPDKIFANNDNFDDRYSKTLETANEKSLLMTTDENLELYRFTWLRAFDEPIVVNIQKRSGEIKTIFTKLNGSGGYNLNNIVSQKEVSPNENDWCKFVELLNTAKYWQMPTGTKSGRDGSFWLLEGVKNNRYHVTHRWSPHEGKYRELGIYMLKLAGFDSAQNKIY